MSQAMARRGLSALCPRAHRLAPAAARMGPRCLCRTLTNTSRIQAASTPESRRASVMADWARYRESKLPIENGQDGQYVGSLGKMRHVSKKLSFADLTLPSGETVQLCSRAEDGTDKAHDLFRAVPAHSPVLVQTRGTPTTEGDAARPTLDVAHIEPLNSIPKSLIVTRETVFPPNKRHLQIRFHPELQARLRFRSWLKSSLTKSLLAKGFTDVETPTLFKTTPEGAREFLVPTRAKGKAYALTQSPQQYKQSLIASGIGRYMQWARCYRDEDSRADRQPEFTQLDMEWAFAGRERVQKDVTDIVLDALARLRPAHSYQDVRDARVPLLSEIPDTHAEADEAPAHKFLTLTFQECIESYGIDKPDLRIPGRIHQLDIKESAQNFVGMISHLEDPLIEAFTFSLNDSSPEVSRKFVMNFMKEFHANKVVKPGETAGDEPQILIQDSSKPLSGFSSVGFEYESVISSASSGAELNDGDLVIFQARPKPEGQYTASSTAIGEFRVALWKALVEEGLLSKPRLGDPGSLQFLWVTAFPMFKPLPVDETWLAGSNTGGIAACHHPFTAPLSSEDMQLLADGKPLEARSAAYDLVLNGTEVGGGSERNHVASVQRFIMEDVMGMDERVLKRFEHLFEALAAGCPPHAGFALGFDRLVALLTDTTTVRDVIAFPKTMKGEDLFVGSPSKLTSEELEPLGLAFRPKKATGEAPVS